VNGLNVLIGDFAATNDGDSEHLMRKAGSEAALTNVMSDLAQTDSGKRPWHRSS
jgi:hypothetical protein